MAHLTNRVLPLIESLESRRLLSASVTDHHETHTDASPNAPADSHSQTHLSSSDNNGDQQLNNMLAKPTQLNAVLAGKTITLTWADNSTSETGFAVYRIAKGKLTQVGSVGANVTTFTDSPAPSGQDVYVVRAFNDSAKSEGSNAVFLKVVDDTPAPLVAPRKLKSQAVSTTSIKLSWEKDSGGTNGYTIERSTDGQTNWTQVGTTAVNVRTFTDTGLSATTKYYYRITVLGPGNTSATSAVLIGMTKKSDKGEPKHDSPTDTSKDAGSNKVLTPDSHKSSEQETEHRK